MKKLILHALISLAPVSLFSQAYMTAGGLRLGTDWGLTVQQRLAKSVTFEGIVQSSLQREEVMLTGLVEKHYPLVFRGLNLYAGAGLHKGWLSTASPVEPPVRTFGDPFGLTLIGGAELTLGRLNFSYDFKPAINLSGGEKNFYTQTGISVRYVFLNNKVYKKHLKKRKKAKRKKEGKGNHLGDGWKFWKKDER
jgi:hypothetical protein